MMKSFLKKMALLFIIFTVTNITVNYIYNRSANEAIKNKTHKNYLKWTDIHNNKNTYDLVVMGASRAYYAFNPMIIDSSLNINSYNMGTSAQDIAESYYSLKEIFEYQDPKYVVLDLFFPLSDDVHDYSQVFSNASFFNSNKTKYDLITEGYGASGIANYFVPVLKFNNYIKQDLMGMFKEREPLKPETNWIKGHLHDTVIVTKKQISKFEPIPNFKNTNFDKERFTMYFNKIKTLVKENNAQLICVRSPYPPTRMKLHNIDDEANYYKTFMSKTSIPYFDLNSYKTNKYIYEDQDFADYHHPNYKGAKKASMQLVEAIKENRL